MKRRKFGSIPWETKGETVKERPKLIKRKSSGPPCKIKTVRTTGGNIRYKNKPKQNKTERSLRLGKDVSQMITFWNEIASECAYMSALAIRKAPTKRMVNTARVCRRFLSGELNKEIEFVAPKEGVKHKPYSFDNFCEAVRFWEDNHLNVQVGLLEFICGSRYAPYPSIFFRYCVNNIGKTTANLKIFSKQWEKFTGKEASKLDTIQFHTYLNWAEPHFEKLYKRLRSLKSTYPSSSAVIILITFGTLREFTKSGKEVSSGILNQDFFKTLMEDFRKNKGYVV
jgi:hypothetical protein